ncbi:MAG: Ig-like domain-containing protein [Gemmatimonadota bacterium]|nr:MAG: Ig-like domain-containing protein [Gemmatimonadota bacterium]
MDKIPPEVIATSPPPGATGIDVRTVVTVNFNEWMENKSLKESIFISPIPKSPPKIKLKGKKIEIDFVDGLDLNQTYVITVGTGAKDLHNNGMRSSFTFAFSTGEQIDKGRISGRIVSPDEDVEGVFVWAYASKNRAEPDPARHPPDYVTQAAAFGFYSFSYLMPGRYRLFALRDADGDGKYTVEQDALGVPTGDVLLSPERLEVENVDYMLTVQDTTRPEFVSVVVPDRMHVDLKFSEALEPESMGTIRMTSSARHVPVEIRAVSVDRNDRSLYHVLTEVQHPGRAYEVNCCGVRDAAGNHVASEACTLSFVGSAVPDTSGPRIVATEPQDSALRVPLEVEIEWAFSEAMDTTDFVDAFTLKNVDGRVISGILTWPNLASCVFIPHQALRGRSQYVLTVDSTKVSDWAGNRLRGAGTELSFMTRNPDTLGYISGTLIDEDSSASGQLFVSAESLTGAQPPVRTVLSQPDDYELRNLMPGWYRVWAFRDEDGNGGYSHGCPFPIAFAERFAWYPDSIEVRSRWETQAIDLVLRERNRSDTDGANP